LFRLAINLPAAPPPIPKTSIVPSAVSVEAVSLMIGETL